MFGFLKGGPKKTKFDRKVLRKNDISLLILDERWNSLFNTAEKSAQIIASEEKLKDLLKEQARLTTEAKELPDKKKRLMERIIQLTPEAYEKNDEKAREEMQACDREIKQINERMAEVEEELDKIPESMREINLELLEHTVNQVYFKIRTNQKRVQELDGLIENTKERLKAYIDERESLTQDGTDVYSYFHDLLGREELEKLDREFFKG